MVGMRIQERYKFHRFGQHIEFEGKYGKLTFKNQYIFFWPKLNENYDFALQITSCSEK